MFNTDMVNIVTLTARHVLLCVMDASGSRGQNNACREPPGPGGFVAPRRHRRVSTNLPTTMLFASCSRLGLGNVPLSTCALQSA